MAALELPQPQPLVRLFGGTVFAIIGYPPRLRHPLVLPQPRTSSQMYRPQTSTDDSRKGERSIPYDVDRVSETSRHIRGATGLGRRYSRHLRAGSIHRE